MSSDKSFFQFPEIYVVEASAGSGKTYALAKRYVQLLLHNAGQGNSDQAMRNILALTFTKKAAFEMKRRILLFLRSIALGAMSADQISEIIRPLNISAAQARDRARGLMESLIRHYNYFQVETIDKFINVILTGCAYHIGVSANFRIQTNTQEHLQYCLDDLLDQAFVSDDVYEIVREFLQNYLFLEQRSSWFPKKDMLKVIKNLFEQYNTFAARFLISPVKSEKFAVTKQMILKEMRLLKEILPMDIVHGNRFNIKKFEEFLEKHPNGFDVDHVPGAFRYAEIPLKKNARPPAEAEQLWSLIHLNLQQLCEDESTSLFNAYVCIFDHIRQAMDRVASKEDVLFLSELNRRVAELMHTRDLAVEELYYRLATRLEHYLIDEFQDTNRLQWGNLRFLIDDALAARGSLFYVGDKKQAIYGFRGGEADLFDEIEQTYRKRIGADRVRKESLSRNWRSRQNLVAFTNQIFALDNLQKFLMRKEQRDLEKKTGDDPVVEFLPKDIQRMRNIFQDAQQQANPGKEDGYVLVERIEIKELDERQDYIRQRVLDVIRTAHIQYSFGDIAILTRTNQQTALVTDWLLQENIPVRSERTLSVKQNRLVQDFIEFLKFLNSPPDDLAFAKFIQSELFIGASGISLDVLQVFLFRAGQESRSTPLYVAFRDQFPDAWEKLIELFFKNVGLYPLYELMISICQVYYHAPLFARHQGFLMHFLERIKAHEPDYVDVGSFLEFFDALEGEEEFVYMSEADAVEILTTHKAKGLEFSVVILPFFGMDIRVGAGADNKMAYVMHKSKEGIQLLKLKEVYRDYSMDLFEIYADEYKKEFFSELNNAYVALTRAIDELHVFIPSKIGRTYNPAWFLIPEEITEIGRRGNPLKAAVVAQRRVLRSSPTHDWVAYLKDEYLAFEQLRQQTHQIKGRAVHMGLALIHDLTVESMPEFYLRTEEMIRRAFPSVDARECVSLISDVLRQKSVRHFFDLKDGESCFIEQEIVAAGGISRRVDRCNLRSDRVEVLEFKTGALQQGHEQQIREYMALLRDIYPQKQVEGFLIQIESGEVKRID